MEFIKSLLIPVDEQTMVSLNRLTAPGKRKRSEFVRQAIRKAVRDAEYRAMREAYRKQPDTAVYADDWSMPEEFNP